MIIHNPILTGSFTVNGTDVASITSSAANLTALNAITASILSTTGSLNTASGSAITRLGALEVTSGSNITRLSALETASGSAITRLGALEVTSGSNITRLGALETASGSAITRLGSIEVVTGSNITRLSSLEAKTGSYATTGSNTFIGTQTISGSILQSGSFTSTGTLTAQTLVVQTITSSVDFVTGSTRFGSILDNTHQFTGSVGVSGSLGVTGSVTFGGTGFFGSDVFTYNNGGIFFSGGSSYASGIFQNSSNSLILQTGTTPRLTVSASGAVGIGTTTPLYQFDINTANYRSMRIQSSDDAIITLGSTIASSQNYSIGVSSNTSGQGTNLFWIGTSTSNPSGILTKNLVITSAGNVGIGTSSPNSILEISSTTPIIRIQASDSGTFHGIEFRQAGGFDAFIKQLPVTGEFKISSGRSVGWGGFTTFYTDTVERMRMTSGGKVGIGNSNPNNIVDIYGTGSNTVGLLGVRSSGGGTFIMGRLVSAETSNQTQTIATCSTEGTNERIFLKIQVVNVSAVADTGNCHVGYALWSKNGTKSATTMTLDSGNSNVSNTNVGSLSWSGNNLQYTTNRNGNYEMNHITILACARDSGVVS